MGAVHEFLSLKAPTFCQPSRCNRARFVSSARVCGRSVRSVRVSVQQRTHERTRTSSENRAATESLSGAALNCTPLRHQGRPGNDGSCANYGLKSWTFQATRTVRREPAPTTQIADGSVDSAVARFLN